MLLPELVYVVFDLLLGKFGFGNLDGYLLEVFELYLGGNFEFDNHHNGGFLLVELYVGYEDVGYRFDAVLFEGFIEVFIQHLVGYPFLNETLKAFPQNLAGNPSLPKAGYICGVGEVLINLLEGVFNLGTLNLYGELSIQSLVLF